MKYLRLILSLSIIVILCISGCSTEAPDNSLADIQAVENNLKPILCIKGQPPPAMNILDRM